MTTYYVDNTASGPGTPDDEGDPYELINNLTGLGLLDGDTIKFKRGQIHQFSTYFICNSGVGLNLDAYGTGAIPDLDGQNTRTVYFDYNSTTSNVLIQNIRFINQGVGGGWGCIRFDGTCTGTVTLNNVHATGVISLALYFKNAVVNAALAITNCTFELNDAAAGAIYVNNTAINADSTINGITVTNSGVAQTNALLRGIHVYLKVGTGSLNLSDFNVTSLNRGIVVQSSDDLVVEDNVVDDCWNQLAYPAGSGVGVECDSLCTNVIVRNNTISGCNRGIRVDTTATGALGIVIVGNTVIESIVNGIDLNGCGGNDFIVAHNNVRHAPEKDGHGIVIQNALSTFSAEFKNNVVHTITPTTYPGDTTNIQCIALSASPGGGSFVDVDINNNQYYVTANASGDSAAIGKLSTTASPSANYATLATWQTALQGDAGVSGEETNGLNGVVEVGSLSPYFVTGRTDTLIGAGANITGVNDSDEYGTPPMIGHSITTGVSNYIAITRRALDRPPTKRVYPKTQRGSLRGM